MTRRACGPLSGLLVLLAGCTPLTPPDTAPAAALQALYRVRYQGPAGSGSLRLVLRQADAERFQLLAADALGRAAWSLDHDRAAVLLVDHREQRYCLAGGELRVPEVALAPLPLRTLPRVLAGLAPVPPPPGELDWLDAAGRHWSVLFSQGRVRSWTLWQEGEPQLWWQSQPRGGILSHRQGSQFRWRLVVREPLAETGYRRLEPPSEYSADGCPG